MKTLRVSEQGIGDTRRLPQTAFVNRYTGLFPTEVLTSSGSTGFISATSEIRRAPRQVFFHRKAKSTPHTSINLESLSGTMADKKLNGLHNYVPRQTTRK